MLAYKRNSAVEAAKREALDRQLDFLVGQTQRYSSLLAKKLASEAAAAAQVAACSVAALESLRCRTSHSCCKTDWCCLPVTLMSHCRC